MTNFEYIKSHLTVDVAVKLVSDFETCKNCQAFQKCVEMFPNDDLTPISESDCEKVIKAWLASEYVVKEQQLPGQISIDDYMKGSI